MKKTITFLAVAFFVLGLVFWVLPEFLGEPGASDYTAVYMTNGDIYFGKLSTFPSWKLQNVWYMQKSVAAQNPSQLGLMPLTSALWGPTDTIAINSRQVLFRVRLRSDSQLVHALENPSLLQDLQQKSVPAATSTGK